MVPTLLIPRCKFRNNWIRHSESTFASLLVVLTWIFCGRVELELTGDELKGSFILIANHQHWLDWWYIWMYAWIENISGQVFFLLVYWIQYIPIIGWGVWFFEFVFMRQKWIYDADNLRSKLTLLQPPFALVIFPEGMVNTPVNRATSQRYHSKECIKTPHSIHTLVPKTRGIKYCLERLRGKIDCLMDCTIGYSDMKETDVPFERFSLNRVFFEGKGPKTIHIHTERVKLDVIPLENQVEFTEWIRGVFINKDRLIQKFFSLGDHGHSESKRVYQIAPKFADWVNLGSVYAVVSAVGYALVLSFIEK